MVAPHPRALARPRWAAGVGIRLPAQRTRSERPGPVRVTRSERACESFHELLKQGCKIRANPGEFKVDGHLALQRPKRIPRSRARAVPFAAVAWGCVLCRVISQTPKGPVRHAKSPPPSRSSPPRRHGPGPRRGTGARPATRSRGPGIRRQRRHQPGTGADRRASERPVARRGVRVRPQCAGLERDRAAHTVAGDRPTRRLRPRTGRRSRPRSHRCPHR